MSFDYIRERQLAHAAYFAQQLAGKHAEHIDALFPVLAEGNEGQPTTATEITAVLWASYLGHLAEHLSRIVGKGVATAILTQVLAAHTGGERDH